MRNVDFILALKYYLQCTQKTFKMIVSQKSPKKRWISEVVNKKESKSKIGAHFCLLRSIDETIDKTLLDKPHHHGHFSRHQAVIQLPYSFPWEHQMVKLYRILQQDDSQILDNICRDPTI